MATWFVTFTYLRAAFLMKTGLVIKKNPQKNVKI